MKYSKKRKRFEASNVYLSIEDGIKAVSYDWWTFVTTYRGLVVFNPFGYSVTTSKHQHKVRRMLKDLDIHIDVEIKTSKSLSCLQDNEIPKYSSEAIEEQRKKVARARKEHTKINAQAELNAMLKQNKVLDLFASFGPNVSRAAVRSL